MNTPYDKSIEELEQQREDAPASWKPIQTSVIVAAQKLREAYLEGYEMGYQAGLRGGGR